MKVKIQCPRCQRTRLVESTSAVALVGETAGSEWLQNCETCRLLLSVEKHKQAIAVLHKKINYRRLRGL